MRCLSSSLFSLLLLVSGAGAQDEPGGILDPEELFSQIVEEYEIAQMDFMEALQEAKSEEERQRLVDTSRPRAEEYAPRLLEVAEVHAKDPVAFDCLAWVVSETPPGNGHVERATRMLEKDHLDNEMLGEVCEVLGSSPHSWSGAFLRRVLERSPHREVRGLACMGLARHSVTRSEDRAAEAFLERVIRDFGDVYGTQGGLEGVAKRELYALRNLAVGKKAPEISGEDIDGVSFKLSDYLGKVVLLDFWGHW